MIDIQNKKKTKRPRLFFFKKEISSYYFLDFNFVSLRYAFANIVVANGFMTTICLFSFPHVSNFYICIFGLFVSIIGGITYLFALKIDTNQRNERIFSSPHDFEVDYETNIKTRATRKRGVALSVNK
jgi:hypothetical protein